MNPQELLEKFPSGDTLEVNIYAAYAKLRGLHLTPDQKYLDLCNEHGLIYSINLRGDDRDVSRSWYKVKASFLENGPQGVWGVFYGQYLGYGIYFVSESAHDAMFVKLAMGSDL